MEAIPTIKVTIICNEYVFRFDFNYNNNNNNAHDSDNSIITTITSARIDNVNNNYF